MKKKILTDIETAKSAGMLSDGRYFERASDGLPLVVPYYYLNRIDLENLLLFTGEDADLHPEVPDINRLVAEGLIRPAAVYREYSVDLPQFRNRDEAPRFTDGTADQVVKEFAAHGFGVTRGALMHNYMSWLIDRKSGYRDEKNGYHLFSPCGCNVLSFRASSLEDCLGWQGTYQG